MQSFYTTMRDKRLQFEKVKKIGEGAFGTVFESKDAITGRKVAVKKIKLVNMEDGVNFTALREIKVLQELKHPNIIELIDVFINKNTINIVYEFCDTDLFEVINDQSIYLSEAHIKTYMRQILEGISECHRNWVLHRDMKPSNLLLTRDGVLRLADFGLAKVFGSPDRRYSPQSVTRWYRPPELLYGAEEYGPGVDIWSCGCIFAEMMLRRAYFPGENELDQLAKIFAALGTPNEETWPGLRSLPMFVEFEDFSGVPFKSLFTAASDEAIDLLSKMLVYDPSKRISAQEALNHPWFHMGVKPTPLDQLPFPTKQTPETKETSTKRRRSADSDNMNISVDSLGKEERSVRRKLVL